MSILKIRDENGNIVEIPALKGDAGKSAYEYAQNSGYTGTEEEFSEKLSTEWVNESDLETEVTNQLESVKADIVQELINQLQGLPVFGTVNDDNTITVTSALADGTYTLMYEYEDGTTSKVGTIIVEQEIIKESYTNIIDTVGYTDGVRLSTSTGETKTQTDYVTTGIIDVTDLSTPIVIRTKGVDFSQDYAAIVSYQEDGSINSAGIIPTLVSGTSGHASLDSDGNVTLNVSNWTSATRFRICGYGSGENLIVTINEEITDNTVSAYTNLADTSDEMWVENYRINSSGNTVEVTEDQRGDDTIVMTNLIDISSVSNSTKIHLKSLDMLSNKYTRIYFYDSNKNYLTFWQPAGNYVSNYLNVSDYNTDVQIVTKLNQLIDNLNLTDVSYIRFGGILTNTAENVIITIDEEIPTLYTNLADTSSEDWLTNYRINSNSSLVTVSGGTTDIIMTNYIDISYVTDIHIKGIDLLSAYTGSTYYGRIYMYDKDKNYSGYCYTNSGSPNTIYDGLETAGYEESITVLHWADVKNSVYINDGDNNLLISNANIAYIRLGGLCSDTSKVVITGDEEIV